MEKMIRCDLERLEIVDIILANVQLLLPFISSMGSPVESSDCVMVWFNIDNEE